MENNRQNHDEALRTLTVATELYQDDLRTVIDNEFEKLRRFIERGNEYLQKGGRVLLESADESQELKANVIARDNLKKISDELNSAEDPNGIYKGDRIKWLADLMVRKEVDVNAKSDIKPLDPNLKASFDTIFSPKLQQAVKEFQVTRTLKSDLAQETTSENKIKAFHQTIEANQATLDAGKSRNRGFMALVDSILSLSIYAIYKGVDSYKHRGSAAFWKSSSEIFRDKALKEVKKVEPEAPSPKTPKK